MEIPDELVCAAGWNVDNLALETVRLLALELYGKTRYRLGGPLSYARWRSSGSWNSPAGITRPSTMELTIWKKTGEHLNGSVCDRCLRCLTAHRARSDRRVWISLLRFTKDRDGRKHEVLCESDIASDRTGLNGRADLARAQRN